MGYGKPGHGFPTTRQLQYTAPGDGTTQPSPGNTFPMSCSKISCCRAVRTANTTRSTAALSVLSSSHCRTAHSDTSAASASGIVPDSPLPRTHNPIVRALTHSTHPQHAHINTLPLPSLPWTPLDDIRKRTHPHATAAASTASYVGRSTVASSGVWGATAWRTHLAGRSPPGVVTTEPRRAVWCGMPATAALHASVTVRPPFAWIVPFKPMPDGSSEPGVLFTIASAARVVRSPRPTPPHRHTCKVRAVPRPGMSSPKPKTIACAHAHQGYTAA